MFKTVFDSLAVMIGIITFAALIDPRAAKGLGCSLLAWSEGMAFIQSQIRRGFRESWLVLLGWADGFAMRRAQLQAEYEVRR